MKELKRTTTPVSPHPLNAARSNLGGSGGAQPGLGGSPGHSPQGGYL